MAGTPDTRPRRRGGDWLWIAVLLITVLGVNLWLSTQLQTPEPRARIPYSPLFLDQVHAGNVASIASNGDTVQGQLRKPIRMRRAGGAAGGGSFTRARARGRSGASAEATTSASRRSTRSSPRWTASTPRWA